MGDPSKSPCKPALLAASRRYRPVPVLGCRVRCGRLPRPGNFVEPREMGTMVKVEEQVQIASEELVNSVAHEEANLAVRRYFTIAGRDPFDEIEWELRHAH